MYRLRIAYMPTVKKGDSWIREFIVLKCWDVREEWAFRAVKLRRRRADQVRLELLSPETVQPGRVCNPYRILCNFLESVPVETKAAWARDYF